MTYDPKAWAKLLAAHGRQPPLSGTVKRGRELLAKPKPERTAQQEREAIVRWMRQDVAKVLAMHSGCGPRLRGFWHNIGVAVLHHADAIEAGEHLGHEMQQGGEP